jgi:predicted RNase H-like HicB family nuclease
VEEVTAATSFSTTVNGKQYSGSVQESDGEYTASASGLTGASATGSSAQAAENNLTTRINEIV